MNIRTIARLNMNPSFKTGYAKFQKSEKKAPKWILKVQQKKVKKEAVSPPKLTVNGNKNDFCSSLKKWKHQIRRKPVGQ
jgi:hypothetical protein